ncbi:uncharacterized protein LOC8271829 isoform X4 [Ricinus communis]|uniref:uncharacterized protein LOC8271829 isoform X4 n=1 Tax=Ricinus communis TaxID=3988 RepID=UPI00201B26B1|nr:uncharacterized protein LOC8271829 isoform X4 [Ricinus communis]
MATASKARIILEGLVREGSFKWLLSKRSSFDEEFEEMGRSPSASRSWIAELSPLANMIVRRCSKILGISASELQESFNVEASDSVKHPSRYARNFLEYCCFRALAMSVQVTGHLTDKKFRRLTYDMMLAWEIPAAASQHLVNIDEDLTVGLEAFSRIAPAVPIIANVIISENLFEVLTMSTGGRLHFSTYDKYLSGLERAIKKMKTQSDSSLLSAVRFPRGEKIIEVDGTVTSQPVLEHVGISAWPGRLILTDHALYFEALRVVSYDKPKVYDLSEDLKQVVKPELTGPWGTRLFDKAVSYKSISLSEPVVIEFPEFKGHSRRDYWLSIIQEILYVHRFINKFQLTGVEQDEALSKAVLGILRLQAIQEISELLHPVVEVGKWLLAMASWDDPVKSLVFCLIFTYVIWRGWLAYAFGMALIFVAMFMVVTRLCNQGQPVDELKVPAPPPMNTMEQLLAVQNAISQAEQVVQDGNVVLLKFRALLLSCFPQASEKFAVALLCMALILVFIPSKYIVLLTFLEAFTRYSPPRKASSERWLRRLREWWFSIPAAPVVLEREKEDKKKK